MFTKIKLRKNERDFKDVERYIKLVSEKKAKLVKTRSNIRKNNSKNPAIRLINWLYVLQLTKKIRNLSLFLRNCSRAKEELMEKKKALIKNNLKKAYNV